MPPESCALCDIERLELTPREAFALGVVFRLAMPDSATVPSMMCDTHRAPMMLAMMGMARKFATPREE
jgi:hypothetical protein